MPEKDVLKLEARLVAGSNAGVQRLARARRREAPTGGRVTVRCNALLGARVLLGPIYSHRRTEWQYVSYSAPKRWRR
jgi:hypothetical protein